MKHRYFSRDAWVGHEGLPIRASAVVLAAFLLVTSLHDVSTAWDVWYYHLPFASRIWGIVPGFEFSVENETRFHGFPLGAEALQGLLWKVTGRPECANLVSLGALVGLVEFGYRRLRVPRALGLISLVAIPMVQMHASSAYIDLLSNTLAAVLYFTALNPGERLSFPRQLGEMVVVGTALSCTRFQMIPVVLFAFVLTFPRAWNAPRLWRLAYLLSPIVIFVLPWKNLVLHGNPFFPVRFEPFGIPFRFAEEAYEASPRYLEHVVRPVRWLASIFEVGLPELSSHHRWSIDQYTPREHPAYRMGGFFGAYVVFQLAVVTLVAVKRRREAEVRRAVGALIVLSLLISAMPQSHECRYYLVWMLVLVTTSATLSSDRMRHILSWGALGAVLLVGRSTEWQFLTPSGLTFRELVAAKVDANVVEEAQRVGRLCVLRQPWNMLYAPTFHPGPTYRVREAVDASECAGEPLIR